MSDTKLTTITATELQQKHGQLLKRVYQNSERLMVKRGGYDIAVILSVQDYGNLVEAAQSGRKKK